MLLPTGRRRNTELSIFLPKCPPFLRFLVLMMPPSSLVRNLGVSSKFSCLTAFHLVSELVTVISISAFFPPISPFLVLFVVVCLDGDP